MARKKNKKNTKNGDSSLGSKTVDLRSFSVGRLLLWWVATAHVNAASTSGWELEQGHLRAPLGVPRMQSQQPVKTVPLLTRGFVERRDERAWHVGIPGGRKTCLQRDAMSCAQSKAAHLSATLADESLHLRGKRTAVIPIGCLSLASSL